MAFAAVGAATWTACSWMYKAEINGMKADWSSKEAEFERKAREESERNYKQLQEARNAATKRESTLRNDSAALRSERNELQNELAEANRRLSSLSSDACYGRVVALTNVFESCVGRYAEMAESCDRHVSDKQTLMEGWPR